VPCDNGKVSEPIVPAPQPAPGQQPLVPQPSGTAAQPATPQPLAPPLPWPREPHGTDTESVVIAGVGALLLIVAAIVNAAASTGFPYNAPVEWIWSAGITIDLLAAAAFLTVRFFVIRRRPRVPGTATQRMTAWAVVGSVLTAIALLGWLLLGGAGFIVHLIADPGGLRYYIDVNGFFLLGFVWVAALILSVIAYRRGRNRRNNTFAVTSIAVLVLLVVPTLTSGILYGLGLTD
jgi:hypothetical protein